MTFEEMKEWIDNASYYQLLKKWRFSRLGDPFFQGEIGEYYSDVMSKRGEELDPRERGAISKQIGWT